MLFYWDNEPCIYTYNALHQFCMKEKKFDYLYFHLGIPVLLVTVLVGVNGPDEFKTKHACWCRGGTAVFWTFTATMGFILTVC